MRRIMKKAATALLTAALAGSMLSACARTTSMDTQVVATFGEDKIYMDEVHMAMRNMQYGYEEFYAALFGQTDIWTSEEMVKSVKTEVMSSIYQTKALVKKAEADGITLTDEEKEKVRKAVEEECASEHFAILDSSKEVIERVYTENAIANKVYLAMVADIDTTIGDDEFLQKKISYVKIVKSTVSEEEEEKVSSAESEEESEAETKAPLTDEELQAKMKAYAEEVEGKLKDGEKSEDIIKEYSDLADFTFTQSKATTIGEDSTADYVEEAWKLKTDETAIVEIKDNGGYFVVICLDDNDEEARDKKIEAEYENRRKELFKESYAKLLEEGPEFTVDQDVLAEIKFEGSLYKIPEETKESTTDEGTSEGETTTEGETTAEVKTTEAESTSEEESSTKK